MDPQELLARIVDGETVFPALEVASAGLVGARLKQLGLGRSRWIDVDLRGADLTGANFTETILTGANFIAAVLTATDFARAIGGP